jgi:hypothetical protein
MGINKGQASLEGMFDIFNPTPELLDIARPD